MVVALLRVHDAAGFRGHARRDALSALTDCATERIVWSLLIFNKDQIG